MASFGSAVLVLSLFWSLVHCQQTFPYVSFMGQNLPDHSYVDLSTVGSASDNSDSVVCHTDLSTCCSGGQGIHRGDWYFPAGTRVPIPEIHEVLDISESRGAQSVVIHHTRPTGIYRCDIPTNAVHDDTDILVGDTVYVGLYVGRGGKYSPWLKLL